MRDRQIVRVKSPKLRTFRNNMRRMWLSLILNQDHKMRFIQETLIDHSGKGPLFKTKDHVKKYMGLKYSMVEAKRMGNYSICLCPICMSHEEDMIWDAYSETWYCESCYNHLYSDIKE